MSYDNEHDAPIMNTTISPREFSRAVINEVPVRPGAPLTMRAIHTPGENGNAVRHRLPAPRAQA